jgi:hypothetical protein
MHVLITGGCGCIVSRLPRILWRKVIVRLKYQKNSPKEKT